MADRVFPNNLNVDMGSKTSFSGINWSFVEESMKNNKYAQDTQSAEIMRLVEEFQKLTPNEQEEAMEEMKNPNEPESDSEQGDKEMPDNDDESKEASSKEANTNTKMRKIAFTHPNQISAEAIEAAQAAGDTRLVNTILAARKENRMRIASVIQKNLEESLKFAENSSEEKMDEPKKSKKEDKKEDKKEGDDKFASANSFTKSQRTAFVNAALAQGMPIEYINAMCPPKVSKKVAELSEKVKTVFASNLSEEVKADAIKSMIREAKLSPESKSEFVDYWNNILGYQDKSFWPSVAEDYTEKQGDK